MLLLLAQGEEAAWNSCGGKEIEPGFRPHSRPIPLSHFANRVIIQGKLLYPVRAITNSNLNIAPWKG
jgi:hypothetical protein